MAGNSKQAGRGVISKATAVLDAFLPRSTELSLGELARRCGLPTSTTYRLAEQLVEWGGLEHRDGGYRLGLRIWELGMLARQASSPVDVITPFMHDLYDVVHERIQLAVLDNGEVIYVKQLVGSGAAARPAGAIWLPIHATAVGKILLAGAEPDRVESLLPGRLQAFTTNTITDRDVLLAQLEDVRRNGVAYSREELTPKVASVAAPIRNSAGEVIAALSMSVRSKRMRRYHATAVMATATGASRELRSYAPNWG